MISLPTKFAAICGAAFVVVGCAGQVRSPEGATLGSEYAELVFALGVADTVSATAATTQEYRLGSTAKFAEARTVKIFTWAAKQPAAVLVPVRQRTFVYARMTRLFGAPGVSYNGNDWCINGASFLPEPNRRYRIAQRGEAAGVCRLAILDEVTGQEAPGLEPVDFAG